MKTDTESRQKFVILTIAIISVLSGVGLLYMYFY